MTSIRQAIHTTLRDSLQSTPTQSSDTAGYTYDKSGNILSSTEYDLSSYYGGENNYVYDSEDRLISYNGETITYDLSGNPLNYRDGMTMTWKAGRQLKTLTKNSVTSTYTYDADGMRTKKQVENSVTEYIISGDGIAALKSGSYGVYFMLTVIIILLIWLITQVKSHNG